MSDQERTTVATASDRTVIERDRGSAGGIIAAIALLILVLGVLKYFGALPF